MRNQLAHPKLRQHIWSLAARCGWGQHSATTASPTQLTASLLTIWTIKCAIMMCLPVRLLLGGQLAGCCLLVPAQSVRAAVSQWAQLNPPSCKWKEQAPWQSKNKSWVLQAAHSNSRPRWGTKKPQGLRFHHLKWLEVVKKCGPRATQGSFKEVLESQQGYYTSIRGFLVGICSFASLQVHFKAW